MNAERLEKVEVIRGNNERVVGYACRKCGILYTVKGGDDAEDRAFTCCAPYACSECKAETERYHTLCRSCSYTKRLNAFIAKGETPWDGKFPIVVWDSDKYLFDEEQLLEYIHEYGWTEFEGCDEVVPRSFEVHDYLSDDLHEDSEMEGDWREFDKTVNAWIVEHFPKHYEGNGQRITPGVEYAYPTAKKGTDDNGDQD